MTSVKNLQSGVDASNEMEANNATNAANTAKKRADGAAVGGATGGVTGGATGGAKRKDGGGLRMRNLIPISPKLLLLDPSHPNAHLHGGNATAPPSNRLNNMLKKDPVSGFSKLDNFSSIQSTILSVYKDLLQGTNELLNLGEPCRVSNF